MRTDSNIWNEAYIAAQREEEHMSQRREVSLTCPQCGKEHPFIIWNSINTTLDPEMKEAVKDRSAFRFVCPDCGAKTYIDYDLLYHQMEDRIMIHYARLDESAEQIYQMLTKDDPEDMVQDMLRNHYLIRIARSQNQLREKIAIFDAGLDDRIIEIYKIFILRTVQEKDPDCKDIEMLYYKDPTEGKDFIQIIADGKTYGVVELRKSTYDEYRDRLPDIRKDGPYIDRSWALEKMKTWTRS